MLTHFPFGRYLLLILYLIINEISVTKEDDNIALGCVVLHNCRDIVDTPPVNRQLVNEVVLPVDGGWNKGKNVRDHIARTFFKIPPSKSELWTSQTRTVLRCSDLQTVGMPLDRQSIPLSIIKYTPWLVENLPATITISEHTSGGCAIYRLQLLDDIVSALNVFTFNAYPQKSEELFFYDVNDFTVHVSESADLDFETQNIHILEFPVHFSRRTELFNLTIRLDDVNEAPSFPQHLYVLDYKENKEEQSTTIEAEDRDIGDNMTYSLQNIESSPSLVVPFLLNQTTGELILAANYDVDHGQQSTFYLKLTATDSGNLNASTVIVVRIQNINDNSPTCRHLTIYSPSCMPLGEPILDLTAEDMDGSLVLFALSPCNSSTNGNQGDMELDYANDIFLLSVNGTLSQKRHASSGIYHLNISVVDPDGLTGRCVVTVHILPCNASDSSDKGESLFESTENDKRDCYMYKHDATLSWALPLCIVFSVGVTLTLTSCFWKAKHNQRVKVHPQKN